MFIFWGHRIRDKKLSDGRFNCPYCQTQQPCQHRAVGRYFTLYFIPLAETTRLDEYIVCGGCGRSFKQQDYRPARPGKAVEAVTWDCPKCGHHSPNDTYQCLECGYSLV